ncbi:MAG: adenylate kinase [Gemmatimonadetes bacterium]|nr:adenylate kinase [Gemmatimonadota bacterium]
MAGCVHILGASGSETTTLAKALATHLGCPHYDADSYFWLPSDPPFQHIRDVEPRRVMLSADLEKPGGWVLSGSLCGWGDIYIPLFGLVVFLWIPHELRMARLAAREVARCASGSSGGRRLSMGDYVRGMGSQGRGDRRRRVSVLYAPAPTGDLLPGFYRRTASNAPQSEPRSMAPTARVFCAVL